ncbi:MAG: hypothetical protein AAGC77_00140 [Pseudomonadota bacterium]
MYHQARMPRFSAPEGVTRLMKIASAEADALRLDLEDIRRVRLSTEASLRRLEEEFMACEGEAADVRERQVEELRARRLGLQTTMITLRGAHDEVAEKLASLDGEIEKLSALTAADEPAATPQATFAARASRAF